MKRFISISTIILSILIFILSFNYIINEIIISNYNNKQYNLKLINSLYIFNFYQPYIAYYNHGNILYQTNDYDESIQKYKIALEKNPPKRKICDIRVNLSLSMIATIDENNYEEAIKMLNEAKQNLYMDNCVSIDDNAKELKNEIDDLYNELENSDDSSSDNDNKEEEEKESDTPKNVEEQLKERRKNSSSSRQSELNMYDNMGDYEYYPGKTW